MKDKLNIPPFYIGQKVVYITGISMPKNSIHVVSDLIQDTCGCWNVYINGDKRKLINKSDYKEYTRLRCGHCRAEFEINMFVYDGGIFSTSFRPLQQQSYPLMTFSKIVEKEKEEILINN